MTRKGGNGITGRPPVGSTNTSAQATAIAKPPSAPVMPPASENRRTGDLRGPYTCSSSCSSGTGEMTMGRAKPASLAAAAARPATVLVLEDAHHAAHHCTLRRGVSVSLTSYSETQGTHLMKTRKKVANTAKEPRVIENSDQLGK